MSNGFKQYPKIDIFVGGKYVCSTTWSKTVRAAIARFKEMTFNSKYEGPVTARRTS